jgi:hypothetical protein
LIGDPTIDGMATPSQIRATVQRLTAKIRNTKKKAREKNKIDSPVEVPADTPDVFDNKSEVRESDTK